MKGLTADAADPDIVAFGHKLGLDHASDPMIEHVIDRVIKSDRVTDRVCRMTDRVRHSSTLIRTGTRTHNYIMSRYVIEFLTKKRPKRPMYRAELSTAEHSRAGQGRAVHCRAGTVQAGPTPV